MEKQSDNPLNLEVGKEYWLKYIGCKSDWKRSKITHFTPMGHPWAVTTDRGGTSGGIVSPFMYEMKEMTPQSELEAKAREFLISKGLKGLVNDSPFPEWLAEFYNTVSPDFKI